MDMRELLQGRRGREGNLSSSHCDDGQQVSQIEGKMNDIFIVDDDVSLLVVG